MTKLEIRYLLFICTIFVVGASHANDKVIHSILYNNHNIKVDGVLDEWSDIPVIRYRTTSINSSDPNMCFLQWMWDEQYLYCAIKIDDRFLVGLEKPGDIKRIHYNDSFEIYLDSGNDSRDTIDLNDYQFIFEIGGGSAVFRGDRLNLRLKHLVPKAAGIANITFYGAITYSGTINNNADADAYYSVECRIPWAGIGIEPRQGFLFKADFCTNDNDTIVDFKTLPQGPVKQYTNTSMLGYHNFGYPSYWSSFRLAGAPGFSKRVTGILARHQGFLLLLMLLGAVSAVWLLIVQSRRLIFKPVKSVEINQSDSDVTAYNLTMPDYVEQAHPLIIRIRAQIIARIDQQISPEELAQESAISVRQLQRIFQSHLHTTPKAYMVAVKLEIASKLLCNADKNIAEVAYSVGFSDPSYFGKVFRKHFNMSPSEYQERAIANGKPLIESAGSD